MAERKERWRDARIETCVVDLEGERVESALLTDRDPDDPTQWRQLTITLAGGGVVRIRPQQGGPLGIAVGGPEEEQSNGR